METLLRWVRRIAITLNLLASIAIAWLMWTIFSPIIFDNASTLESISGNPWLIALGFAPVSALIALLWPPSRGR
jgi:hypothetical protein